MKVAKVLNNNVIIVQDPDGREQVVMGKGIGFQKRKGDEVDDKLAEKIFVLSKDEAGVDFSALLTGIPPELLNLVMEFVDKAQQSLKLPLKDTLIPALCDHLYYAVERLTRGQSISNALLHEIKQFYPREFALGLDCADLIKKRTGISLPEDEAGFIALHLVNASLDGDMPGTVNVTKLIADIVAIVKSQLGMEIDEGSLDYLRFVTHLKFFALRLTTGQVLTGNEAFLFEEVKKHYPAAYHCVQTIGLYVKNRFHREISADEITFLTVHIQRLRSHHERPQ